MKEFHESALIEARILRDVNGREREKRRGSNKDSLCVEMFGHFEHQGHCCLVFERLGLSLYEYLRKNDYRGLSVDFMRPIALELLQVRSGPLLPNVSTGIEILIQKMYSWKISKVFRIFVSAFFTAYRSR